ncbi:MAG: phosphotransferase [Acidimicrobiia bacterium]
MIGWIRQRAERQWREWTGRTPHRLRSAILTSARHDHNRMIVLLLDGLRPPEVVVKVSSDPVHSSRIEREFSKLREAHEELPPGLSRQVPVALDIVIENNTTALFSTAMRGRRPMVPPLLEPATHRWRHELASALSAVLAWTADLTRLTQSTRSEGCDEIVTAYLDRFPKTRSKVSQLTGISTTRAWQHGDPAIGNLLFDRRRIRLIDWEHASSRSLPWHDQAYVVLVMGLLAAHQSGLDSVAGFDALYTDGSQYGSLIQHTVEDSWSHEADIAQAVHLTAMTLATQRTDAHGAWPKLANHLLEQRGPRWLRT